MNRPTYGLVSTQKVGQVVAEAWSAPSIQPQSGVGCDPSAATQAAGGVERFVRPKSGLVAGSALKSARRPSPIVVPQCSGEGPLLRSAAHPFILDLVRGEFETLVSLS